VLLNRLCPASAVIIVYRSAPSANDQVRREMSEIWAEDLLRESRPTTVKDNVFRKKKKLFEHYKKEATRGKS